MRFDWRSYLHSAPVSARVTAACVVQSILAGASAQRPDYTRQQPPRAPRSVSFRFGPKVLRERPLKHCSFQQLHRPRLNRNNSSSLLWCDSPVAHHLQFQDSAFPATSASIGRARVQLGQIRWVRAGQLRGHGQIRLFNSSASSWCAQGSLGDCWLIGVFAALSDFPGYVETLFEEKELQASGRYRICLFQPESNSWRWIEVDDQVPCRHRLVSPRLAAVVGNEKVIDVPYFSQPLDGEIWPVLLEKAFAKIAGSYGALDGGIPELALQLVTGQKEILRWHRFDGTLDWQQLRFTGAVWSGSDVKGSRQLATRKILRSDELFLRMAYYDQANFLMVASIDATSKIWEKRRSDGLVEGHLYTVLEVQEVFGERLIRLRNPWGAGSPNWKGSWGVGSPLWLSKPGVAADIKRWRSGTQRLRGSQPWGGDGSFWMAFEDFGFIFSSVVVCPSTMYVPKSSRYAGEDRDPAAVSLNSRIVTCGRCHQSSQSVWILAVPAKSNDRRRLQKRQPRWERLVDGDFCLLCLRATAGTRFSAPSKDVAGSNGAELRRLVPGVDYFPFEVGSGALLPVFRPVCGHGVSCTIAEPRHHAYYDHPWLRPQRSPQWRLWT